MQEKNEKIWILKFAVLVMLVSLVPYVIGFARQGSDWVFTGFVFGVEDGNSYIAKMLSGANGHWLFQTPYTAYPQKGAFAFFLYMLLGKLTSSPGQHTQLLLLFHFYRFAAGILMIMATYDFISIFIQSPKLRRLGTALAVLGGGLGFLIFFGFQGLWRGGLPLEFYSPETFGFLELFGLPHLALGRALLLWGLCEYLNWGQPGPLSTKKKIFGGAAWLLLGLVQPLTVAIGWMILGVHLIAIAITRIFRLDEAINWNTLKEYFIRAFWMGLISSPIVIYTVVAFSLDAFLKEWTSQNIILSPPFIDYLLAYGIVLPFTLFGLILMVKSHKPQELLIVSWFLIFPLLAYFPYNLQRRLVEGVWVAIVLLALFWLEKVVDQKAALWIYKFSFSLFLTTTVVFLGSCEAVWHVQEPIYRPKAEVEAFKFLAEQQDVDQKVVLASYSTSNALPAWVPAKVVAGHGPESIHLGTLLPRVEGFFQSSENNLDLLDEFGVDFVLWGPEEQALGGLNLDNEFPVVYHQGDYWIYRVEQISGKIKQ